MGERSDQQSDMEIVRVEPRSSVLYAVTCKSNASDIRTRAIAKLGSHFTRAHLVYPTKDDTDVNPWAIRAWRNPLRVFELMGLPKVSKFLGKWLLFPSANVLFIYAVRKRLLKTLVEQHRAGMRVCLVLTAPPHAAVMLASYVRERLPQIRIVIDWQDLWSYDETYFTLVPKFYRGRLLDREQKAFDAATVNVATNERAQDVMARRYRVPVSKTAAIYHHYYESDRPDGLKENELLGKSQETAIAFIGNLFKPPKVRGDKIFDAIDSLADTRDVTLHLIGDSTPIAQAALTTLRNSCVEYYPYMPLREALQLAVNADLLLVTLEDQPNSKVIMHGKLPHYLMLGVPIIALVPEGSFVADTIRRTGAGIVLSDHARWTEELIGVIDQLESSGLHLERNEREIEKFCWSATSKDWLKVLIGDNAASK